MTFLLEQMVPDMAEDGSACVTEIRFGRLPDPQSVRASTRRVFCLREAAAVASSHADAMGGANENPVPSANPKNATSFLIELKDRCCRNGISSHRERGAAEDLCKWPETERSCARAEDQGRLDKVERLSRTFFIM